MPAPEQSPAFPSTRWSRILAPGDRRDLEALARDYAGPMRAYLAACTRTGGDALDDLAQEAFAWLLASGLLDKADPERGSFRGFLKRALRNFAIEQHRRNGAGKRGGGRSHATLADVPEPVDERARTPEQALDDAWRRELLQRAHERLRDELQGGPRATHYLLFRDYFLQGDDAIDHAALARRHGITRTDVANWLDHAKRRYRALLRELVTATVASAEELQQELRWLFGEGRGA
ncbi:MAG: sigma-70 family RNA polymerase sigma factor [Planctomycetota bacterium]